MRHFEIDDTAAPLIVVSYPDHVTVEDYHGLFERYRALCGVHARIAWLVDFRRFNPLSGTAELRKAAAACFAASKDVLLKSTVCEARIVENTAARGVLIGFDWLTGTKWPTRNFGKRDSAERWCHEQLLR